jgi:hypothetical protein
MESSLSQSAQQIVRPGKCIDLYYADPETAQKQCFRTIQNTRYVQEFTNKSSGSSVFTIPPNNGIQDIVLTFELPAQGAGGAPDPNYAGAGLNRGWGYALIKQVSFRYGGSSQYFLSGDQILQNALRQAPNTGARDAILTLGGEAVSGAAAGGGDFSVARRAYVWLSLPHCVPTAEGKLPPLPSDLLTQQIQVTCELNPVSSIFSTTAPAAGTQILPTALSFAEFQVQQVLLEDQGDALARRKDMTTHALSYPINFVQQKVSIPLANSVSQSVTLTGFRSGEVKSLQCWISKGSDTSGAVKNPFRWIAPEDIVMTYAGEVYARFDKGSGALWNLVNGRIPPAVDDVRLAAGTNVITNTTAALDRWVELPFAQSYDPLTAHSMYVAGKPITNGIVNMTFNLPADAAPAADYVLNVSYVYNAVLTFSQGTCDYVF